MATNELDSILDSLHALQLDLDKCLREENREAKRKPEEEPPPPPPPQQKQQQQQQQQCLEALLEMDESRDDFPPPPPPEELTQLPDFPGSPAVPAASAAAAAAAASEVASNDSGIHAESPTTVRRSGAAVAASLSPKLKTSPQALIFSAPPEARRTPASMNRSQHSPAPPAAGAAATANHSAAARSSLQEDGQAARGWGPQPQLVRQQMSLQETKSGTSSVAYEEEAILPSLMSVTQPERPHQQQQQQQQKQKAPQSPTPSESPVPIAGGNAFYLSSMRERIRVMDQLFNKTNLTRMAVRIHCLDRTTKMLALDERSKTGLVCTMMANKSLADRRLNHCIVEKLPDMKMERIIEDHELLGDTLLAWPANSKNLLFFEEREEKFGALTNPDVYLGGTFTRERGESAQQQMSRVINDLFEGEGSAPPIKDTLHVRLAGTKSWKKRLCILRSSGIYAVKKGKSELKCVTSLSGSHLFTTLGGWTSKGKIEAPTPHGFALKALQTHSLQSKQIHFFAAANEASMKRWCTALRIAMTGNQYHLSYLFAHQSANAK
ncbi:hypothetical protein BOX15_Mlig002797g1 [Macrostomum lignano]|uniref:PH domain-containing protein n=1 Tax=Macrostomum lignano TaxID=282301 RepID=A0A267DKL2_9PLAT|nr:hypothetical protein BOX15_Mlig002797g1 [Macrostomum lignano]